MNFFGGGRPQPTSAEKISSVEQEIEMVSEMFNRLSKACMDKCLSNGLYREADLSKGESVCFDRCAAKYFDVHSKVSEKIQQTITSRAAAQGGAAGAGAGGFMGM